MIGRPFSGPASPAHARVGRAAAASASSPVTVMKAFSVSSCAAMRSSSACGQLDGREIAALETGRQLGQRLAMQIASLDDLGHEIQAVRDGRGILLVAIALIGSVTSSGRSRWAISSGCAIGTTPSCRLPTAGRRNRRFSRAFRRSRRYSSSLISSRASIAMCWT